MSLKKILFSLLLKEDFDSLESISWHNLFRAIWQYLSILKPSISFEQVMSLLGIYPADIHRTFQQNICTRMVTEALFVMVLKIHENVRVPIKMV